MSKCSARLDSQDETFDNEHVNLEDIDRLEKEFRANLEKRREELRARIAFYDEIEIKGLKNFNDLRETVSQYGSEFLTKAIHGGLQDLNLMEEMRTLIPTLEGTFDINTIRENIEGHDPTIKLNPTTVSNNLRKLHKDGWIDLVKRGKGNKTSTYKISQKWLDKLEEEKVESEPVPRKLF